VAAPFPASSPQRESTAVKKPRSIVAATSVGALCSFVVSAVCAQQPDPIQAAKVETLSATVESIDMSKRLVELRSGDKVTTVQVPPEAQNLSQVKVGDEVVVKYYEGLGAQFKKKGESKTVGHVDVHKETTRAGPGAKPGGMVANTVTTTVVIEAVDRPSNSVTFTGPSGMSRTVEVTDPSAQQFISTLKTGDEVEITYTEALALTVEPKKK
jgi:hypothetical protein